MIKVFTTLSLAVLATGCASQLGHPDKMSDQTQYVFGKSVQQNIDAQTVNPNGAEGDVESGAVRAALAQERYREDLVEKPKNADTLSSGEGAKGGE